LIADYVVVFINVPNVWAVGAGSLDVTHRPNVFAGSFMRDSSDVSVKVSTESMSYCIEFQELEKALKQ
jgi:hypothetical protein